MHHRLIRPVLFALTLALVTPAPAPAQGWLLTLEDIYHPSANLGFTARVPSTFPWLDDDHFLIAPVEGRQDGGQGWMKVHAVTGVATPLVDRARFEAAIASVPGVLRDEARAIAGRSEYEMDPARENILVPIDGDLYRYEIATGAVHRLTSGPGDEEEASFSPDGRRVAFVRGNNLYVVDAAGRNERALTTDGSAEILNGKLDWIYQEEIYGRGQFRAYWWSPDSKRIAFLRLDERNVPSFTVVDHIPYDQVVERTPYPQAGDPNPGVGLGVVPVDRGSPGFVDLARYAPTPLLIVNVAWSPDGTLFFQVQDREQTWLDLNTASADGDGVRTVLRETTKAWADQHGNPVWLKDGSFLWLSERTGWKHIYHVRPDGSLVRQVTDGQWEVRTLHGVDERTGWVYFEGTERSPIGNDIYRVRLDGRSLERLSERAGTHKASFNPSFTRYVGTWSDVRTPPQIRTHTADGRELRLIDENRVAALAELRLGQVEFVQVPTRDGFMMEAMLIKPPDFDPSRRYPVYQHTYAGPHSQQVRNAWGGTGLMYHHLLAQKGIVVWVCDNRTASGKGAVSTWAGYKRLGESELRDIEDGIAWLKRMPWVDASRIGISGWSYGGFMVSYALTHSRSFAMGIAGGSVTDWRDYDSIYTERYMLTPQNNPDGYRASSPRFAAANLSGELLLLHGTMDDNVHVDNTLQFAFELQRAGKRFEMMLYPKSRHAVTEPALAYHLRKTMLEFTLRTLRPEGSTGRNGVTQP